MGNQNRNDDAIVRRATKPLPVKAILDHLGMDAVPFDAPEPLFGMKLARGQEDGKETRHYGCINRR